MTATHIQPDLDLIRRIERAAASNLRDYVAACRHVVPQVGVEDIDVAGGVAAFTGHESPLTTVKGTRGRLTPWDLDHIEAFFLRHDVATVTIEAAPWLNDESKRLLGARGYHVQDHEDVVTTTAARPVSGGGWRAEAVPPDEWPELMRRTSELSDDPLTRHLVAAAAQLPRANFYGVREDDRWIACAQAVTGDDVVIFANDGTLPAARGRGAQTALIEARLADVPGGTTVMAEVTPGSGSERNYLRCGFQIAYARTHYVRTVH